MGGLGVWLRRAQDKARVVTAGFQGVSMAMVDGVSTQGGRAGNISMMAQFDKEVADQIEVAKQIVGQPLPSVGIDMGFDPKRINIYDRVKDKKVIIIGLPKAFLDPEAPEEKGKGKGGKGKGKGKGDEKGKGSNCRKGGEKGKGKGGEKGKG